jgi:AcrR family transcriptional regulator
MGPTAAARGQQVRQRLRRAAVELIAERGWRAVTTRVVAERAGVAAGLVHYHFASVEGLLQEAAIGLMREAVAEVEHLLDGARDAEQGLALMLGALDTYTGQDSTSLVFLETYLAATRDTRLGAEVAGIIAGVRQRLADWLDRCGTAAPEPTAAVLAAAIDGLLLHRGIDPTLTAAVARPVLDRIVAEPSGSGQPEPTEEEST